MDRKKKSNPGFVFVVFSFFLVFWLGAGPGPGLVAGQESMTRDGDFSILRPIDRVVGLFNETQLALFSVVAGAGHEDLSWLGNTRSPAALLPFGKVNCLLNSGPQGKSSGWALVGAAEEPLLREFGAGVEPPGPDPGPSVSMIFTWCF